MNFVLKTFTKNLIPIIYNLDKTFYGETVTDGGESLAKKFLSFIGKCNNSKIYSN